MLVDRGGSYFYHEKNIALPIPEQDDPITFESLSYVKCFCSLKEEDEKLRCSRGCSDKIHEISILWSPPKLFPASIAYNTCSTAYCEILTEMPYCICLYSFIGDSFGLVTYTLVAIVIEVVYQLAISTAFYSIETVRVRNVFTKRQMFYVILKGKNTHILLYTFQKKLFPLSSIPLIIFYHNHMILLLESSWKYILQKCWKTQCYVTLLIHLYVH